MTIKELTKFEKKFTEKYLGKDYNPQKVNIMFVRELMERTAYHEAGHFAAKVFTRLELSHVRFISIIPDKYNTGKIRCERAITEATFHQTQACFLHSLGYKLLLEILGGYGSDNIRFYAGKYYDYFDFLYEEHEEEYNDFFFDNDNKSDIGRAFKIANLMSKPHYSANRILKQAFRWTLEMFQIPAVWNVVEITSKRLLEKGKITLDDKIINEVIYDMDFKTIRDIPKWKKRIKV